MLNTIRSNLFDLQVLIIDEISMVGSKMISYIDSRLKQMINNREAAFGGISVIVFGDLRQLRPIGNRWIFQSTSDLHNPYSAIFGSSLWGCFKFFELTEVMRQKNYQPLVVALNNMASGQMSADDIALFQTRISSSDQVPNDVIHLFETNAEVDRFNTMKLNSISSDQHISNAKDFVKTVHLIDSAKNRILESVKSFKTAQTQGLAYSLSISLW